MRDRIAKLVGNGIEGRLILGTFHSVCRRYLVTYGHLIGLTKDFGIADSSDTISIIKRIIKRLRLSIDPRKAQSRISNSKSRGVDHTELARVQATNKNLEQQEFHIIFETYEDQLARSNLLDYDDLLLRCADLLRQHPTCVSNVEVVLIDEFQDTNIIQFDLMRLFAARNKRVTTVGDPDQSIYGWRSAEIKNLKRMQEQYPDTLVIHLQDNYRSSGAILLAAYEVIEQDESRPSKPLLPTHCPGTVPVLRRLPSSEIEALWIVSEIQRTIALTGDLLDHADFVILLRSASLSRHIESAMGKAGIPYRMVGGLRFFDRIEIKVLLDYLRVISQPHNNDALLRIINVPTRGIGTNTAKSLLEDAETKKISLWMHIRDVVQSHNNFRTKISKTAENGLGSFISAVLTARSKITSPVTPLSPENLLKYIIKKIDFQAYLQKTHPEDHESRWANVEELIAQASEYPISAGESIVENHDQDHLPQIQGLKQERGRAAEEALSKFLANVALATELQREDEDTGDKPQSQVTISTIHAAKGLEWPVVFVPSAYEGCIPHSRAEDTDEERRLLYVAMTRAQALLYMSCPTKNSQRTETTLSPFLSTQKIGQCLVNRGPAINSGTVNDICRILGRDHPTQQHIVEASRNLQSQNDDLWPLNGEEDVKAVGARWSRWDNNRSHDHAVKRRRMEEDSANRRSDNFDTTNSAGTTFMGKIGGSITMQNSSNFSCSGFVSATSQLHHLNQLKEIETKDKATSSSKPTARIKPPVSRAAQGSLMSFWNQNDRTNLGPSEPVISRMLAAETEADLVANQSHWGRINSSSSTKAPIQSSLEEHESIQRIPLASIPQQFSAHRLPTKPNISRPHLKAMDDESVRKQYVFISSSPPHGDSLQEEAEGADMMPAMRQRAAGVADMQPAKTLHETSVAQVQTAPKAPKKTLGVRRSMNGWAVKANHGFSVPKMNGGKP